MKTSHLGLLFLAGFGNAHRTLKTPHYTVNITEQCDEYEVGCDKVLYEATSTSGRKISLHGKQIMKMCGDGVTPCHPIGYEFHHGPVVYLVGEDGSLVVKQGTKTLLSEQGTWTNE